MTSGIATTFTQKRSQILPRIASVVKPALGNASVKRPIPGQLDPAASEGATEAGHAPLSLVSAGQRTTGPPANAHGFDCL